MTPLADLIEAMAAEGASMKLIIMAVRAAEFANVSGGHSTGFPPDKMAEKRRAWDRERRAKQRASGGNPPDIPPDNDSALYLSSLTSSQETQDSRKEERKKERKRGEKIPPDFHPTAEHIAAGQQLGFTEQQIIEQAEDMRLWAQSNEHRAVARKTDWNLTFLSWLRRNKPKANGHANASTARNSHAAVYDELIARAEARERTIDLGSDDYACGGGEGGKNADRAIPEPETGQPGSLRTGGGRRA